MGVRDEIAFLSLEDVIAIHSEMLQRFGGSRTPGHRGELDGVTAAVLGHVFGDGNKRTGSGAALVFLDTNGIPLDFPPEDLVDKMIELQQRAEANPATPAGDLVAWFAKWLRGSRSDGRRRRRSRT